MAKTTASGAIVLTAVESSSWFLTGTLGSTSIFPPKCMRKVRSETLSTDTPLQRPDGGEDRFAEARGRCRRP